MSALYFLLGILGLFVAACSEVSLALGVAFAVPDEDLFDTVLEHGYDVDFAFHIVLGSWGLLLAIFCVCLMFGYV